MGTAEIYVSFAGQRLPVLFVQTFMSQPQREVKICPRANKILILKGIV